MLNPLCMANLMLTTAASGGSVHVHFFFDCEMPDHAG